MKKLGTIVFTLILSLALTYSVFAADSSTTSSSDTGTITIEDPIAGHTYDVYQLLTGSVETLNGSQVLVNPVYGQDMTASNTYVANHSIDSAEDFAKDIENQSDSEMQKTADTIYTSIQADDLKPVATLSTSEPSVTLPCGYYMIVEMNGTDNLAADGHYITTILSSSVSVYPKTGALTSSKSVSNDDVTFGAATTQSMDKTVTFKITATLPENAEAYTNGYNVAFNDTLSKGLTYVKGSAKWQLENSDDELQGTAASLDATSDTENTDGSTALTFDLGNVLDAPYSAKNYDTIVITYQATVNSNAVLGSDGNPNTVSVTYSNDMNDSTSTATTVTHKATVYTYQLQITKTDADGKALTGAQFELEQYNPTTKAFEEMSAAVLSSNGTVFTFSGLGDGDYKLVETTTPEGYNTIDPIYFTVTSTTNSSTGALTNVSVVQTNSDWEALTPATNTFAADASYNISTTVINQAGATLPKTGETGTVIFYTCGIALLLAAAVMVTLQVKKVRG